jgi:hypothetical protein
MKGTLVADEQLAVGHAGPPTRCDRRDHRHPPSSSPGQRIRSIRSNETTSKEAKALIAHYEETSLSHTPSVRLPYARHTPVTRNPSTTIATLPQSIQALLYGISSTCLRVAILQGNMAVRRVDSTGPPSSAEFSRQARQDSSANTRPCPPRTVSYRVYTPIASNSAYAQHTPRSRSAPASPTLGIRD